MESINACPAKHNASNASEIVTKNALPARLATIFTNNSAYQIALMDFTQMIQAYLASIVSIIAKLAMAHSIVIAPAAKMDFSFLEASVPILALLITTIRLSTWLA